MCGEWVAVSSPVMFSPGFSAVYTLCIFAAFASQTVVIIKPRRIQSNWIFCCIIRIYISGINKCLSRWNQRMRVRQGCSLGVCAVEFFTVCKKLAEMAEVASKDLTTAKKVTSSWVRPGARDYYWLRSLSRHVLFRGSLNFCSCNT